MRTALLLSFILLPGLTYGSKSNQVIMDSDSGSPGYTPLTTSKPTLADLLTIEPSASIFFSYARELELSSMFADQSTKFSLFVPTNKAVMALARKPHEGPETRVEIELTEEQFHKRAKKNVERWVSAHIIPEYPISFDSEHHQTLLNRKSITFKPTSKNEGQGAEWSRVTFEKGVRIIDKKEALNGDFYLIDGTITTG
ncbi:hypothetical protein B0H34DRAFT_7182 [Crassisporium funariophilum]|nr:hypothetical protein B0H34DRAFT_7182 [Crassisporium funariophilum]